MDPLVSVIIPAHNEEKFISETVNSILNQTYKKIEIIIVDDGSKDKTLELVTNLAKKNKNIRILKFNKGHSAAFARNKGAKIARGSILIFQDGDCIADKKLVSVVVQKINAGWDGVASRTLNVPPKTIIGRAISAQRKLRWETHTEKSKPISMDSGILVANMKKKCFDSLGGFDEKIFYFEDADLTKRFFEKGYSAVYAHNVIEYHHDPEQLLDTIKQSLSFGKGIAWLLRRGKGFKKLILPTYSILVILALAFSFVLPLLLIILLPLLIMFFLVSIKSKDLFASLVFVILFEFRNIVKFFAICVNLFSK